MTQKRKDDKNKPTPAERINYAAERMDYVNDYPDVGSAASMTESTGLMRRLTDLDEEFASYQELCGLQVPKIEPEGAKLRGGKGKDKPACGKCDD